MPEVLACPWGREMMQSMSVAVETLLGEVRGETPWDLAAVLGRCSPRAELFSNTSPVHSPHTHTLSGMAGQQHFFPVPEIRGAEPSREGAQQAACG